ncbi:MAG: response regulator [Cyclobacteriaceae bacterium]
MEVLYVDDQKENLNVFRITFKKMFKVHVTESIDEARELMEKHPIDVIIADHRMPDVTGIELLRQIGEQYPKIKRIIISEYVNDKVIRDALNAYNLDGCMGKPWDKVELQKMIGS